MMGTLEIITPDNAHIIDPIYPHFYRSMNDLMSVQKNAHMRDLSFLIIEKGQVACPGLFQEAYCLTLRGLLVGVAQQWDIKQLKDSLGKAAAVSAEHRLASPEIRRI